MVQRVGCGDSADEDEHNEAHALLSVIRAVEEADAGAGEHHEGTNRERRRHVVFWRFVELREFGDLLRDAG